MIAWSHARGNFYSLGAFLPVTRCCRETCWLRRFETIRNRAVFSLFLFFSDAARCPGQVLRFLSFPELLRARAVSSLLREAASENGCVEVGHEHNRKETLQLLPRLFPRLTNVRITGFPNHRSRFDDHLGMQRASYCSLCCLADDLCCSAATVLAEAAPCLTRLALPWSVRLTDMGLEALANISTLQNIDFEGCSKLTDVGLAEIAKRCQGLHHLRIAGCRAVGGHCLRNLQPNLRSLDLRDCSKLHEGLLAKLLSQLPVLRELYLSRLVQVSDAVLFAAARHCPQLEVLELEGCSKVSDIGLEAVTRRCRGLQSLNLNACGRVSSGFIAKLSRQCPRLIHLHLSTLNGAVDDHALGHQCPAFRPC